MEITYYGHSCFLIDSGGFKILFDPFITGNPIASSIIDISTIEADYILISHGHEDHVGDVESIAQRTGATLIGSFEVLTWFEKKGLTNNHKMNKGGKAIFDFGTVKAVNAEHSSSMPDGTYGGSPMGYVIESGDNTFYYSGDTALHLDMKLIADQYKHIDFGFFSIGDNYTMDVADAVVAASYINTKKMIGMHFNTWPIIAVDPIEADMIARSAEKELILMDIGQTMKIK